MTPPTAKQVLREARLGRLAEARKNVQGASVRARNSLAALENVARHYTNTLLRDAAVNAMVLISRADGEAQGSCRENEQTRAAVLEQVEFFRRTKEEREKSRQPSLVAALGDAIAATHAWVHETNRVVDLERKLAQMQVGP